jgi:predicted SAM-dependent methyltransferase
LQRPWDTSLGRSSLSSASRKPDPGPQAVTKTERVQHASPGPRLVVRLNLGAGHERHSGWINYDRSRAPLITRWPILRILATLAHRAGLIGPGLLRWDPRTRIHDLTKGIPHPSNSVDMIYSSHMLEHLRPSQAQFVLDDCHRVLKPGGVLRLVVPDLNEAAQAYLRRDLEYFPSHTSLIADAFMESISSPTRRENIVRRLASRMLRTDDGGHKWMYDAESLIARLRSVGFVDIERVGFREGKNREIAMLDHRSPHHIHVETFKPAHPPQRRQANRPRPDRPLPG